MASKYSNEPIGEKNFLNEETDEDRCDDNDAKKLFMHSELDTDHIVTVPELKDAIFKLKIYAVNSKGEEKLQVVGNRMLADLDHKHGNCTWGHNLNFKHLMDEKNEFFINNAFTFSFMVSLEFNAINPQNYLLNFY